MKAKGQEEERGRGYGRDSDGELTRQNGQLMFFNIYSGVNDVNIGHTTSRL